MNTRFPVLFVSILVAVSLQSAFCQTPVVPWQDHYRTVLPEGFDPWCGPVAGVSGTTDVVVAHSELQNGKPVDIYYPSETVLAADLPVVVFVAGTPDTANRSEMGRPWMRTNQVLGWGRLIAESGVAAVAYENDGHPPESLRLIGDWLVSNGTQYGLDISRAGIWAVSDSCAVAMDAFRSGHSSFGGIRPDFGVFLYGDLPLRDDHDLSIPLFVVAAAQDGWVDSRLMERFAERLAERGGSVEFILYAAGGHAFDIRGDSEETRGIITQTLEFIADH